MADADTGTRIRQRAFRGVPSASVSVVGARSAMLWPIVQA